MIGGSLAVAASKSRDTSPEKKATKLKTKKKSQKRSKEPQVIYSKV